MVRTEYDIVSGVEITIQLVPWATAAGAIEYLDDGTAAPAGYTLATQAQLDAWAAQQAAQAAAAAKQQQISALLAPVGLTQAWQLDAFMGGTLARAVQMGLTEEQLIAANAAYAEASNIRTQILAILAAP